VIMAGCRSGYSWSHADAADRTPHRLVATAIIFRHEASRETAKINGSLHTADCRQIKGDLIASGAAFARAARNAGSPHEMRARTKIGIWISR